ncbi:MAG: exopolysaccharide biosynthesis polyprenyl glycosylphosphotransferase, partial [Elusimicrobiota bacterium]
YEMTRSLLNIKEFKMILQAWSLSFLISLSIIFFMKTLEYSRIAICITYLILLIYLFLERYLFFKLNQFLKKKGITCDNILIYGAGEVGKKLMEKIEASPKLGYQCIGFIDDDSQLLDSTVNNLKVLGSLNNLSSMIKRHKIQRIFIALPSVHKEKILDIVKVCKRYKVEYKIVPSLYDIVLQKVELSEIDGIPLIGIKEPRLSSFQMVSKRIFDLVFSILVLIMLCPLFIVIAVLVKLTSQGPILFKQVRIGKHGRPFTLFKFRSMYHEMPKYDITPDSLHDKRIFPFGKILRRLSLDELPQLFNVLKGEMSLVGPRPEMPFIVDQYNDLQKERLNVQPGITGLWQISRDRKNPIHHNMDYDFFYINNQSLLLDMIIMLKTIIAVIKGEGVY